MKKRTMRILCIIAAISQISFIFMVVCGYITIGVESRTDDPENKVEESSIEDNVKTEYHEKPVGVVTKVESENAFGDEILHHKTTGSEIPEKGGKHKLSNNLVDGENNQEEEKHPPSSARWCRDVWEHFSPELDIPPYSDISAPESSSYESSD
ncbi:uncharacterized protein LOC111060093 [Nilaparvata lugens]|uniref:uncharacterized protein LOC111060093 n=1 Tax=Nilaparvata lugens TaxID=108931 RepID=UPI00193D2DDA|nr:uncharacterized protein LOC111060093 [Nilaparvata lugens]